MLVAEPAERDRLLADVRAISARYGERIRLPQLTYTFAFARLS